MSRRAYAFPLVLLLWFAGLGAAAQFAKIAVPFAWVRALYPDYGAEVGWLLSLVSLVGAVLGVVAGDIVGRLGAKRVLLSGLVLGGVISLWQAAMPSFPVMLLTRMLEGGSHLAIVVAAPTLITQLSQPRMVGAAMTLWSTFFGVAFVVVAWGVLPFLSVGDLPGLFVGHGVFLLLISVLVLVFLPPVGEIKTSSRQRILGVHLRAYLSPGISAPGSGWLVYTLTFVSLLALVPDRLPPEHVEWAAGLMPLFSIVVSLCLVPLLLRHISSVGVVMLGFSLAASLVLMNFVLQWDLVFVVCLFGVLGLVQGASFSAVPEINENPEDQALAYGVMAQAGNTGNLLGTPLLLFVSSNWGDGAMYLLIAAIYLTAVLMHATLAVRRRRAESL
ncbi:MAG: MFS transporter [Arenibacterium sp.]